jgi:signal transduction histidine kinase
MKKQITNYSRVTSDELRVTSDNRDKKLNFILNLIQDLNFKSLNFKFFLLLSAFCFLHFSATAQTDTGKELLQVEQEVASGNLNDKQMFGKYEELMWGYFDIGDFEKSHLYSQKAIALAREKKNVKEESFFLTSLGEMYSIFGEQDSAFWYLDKSLKLLEGKENFKEECGSYKIRGNAYCRIGDFENGIEAYRKALELCKKAKALNTANKKNIDENILDEIGLLSNISNIYGQMYNLDKQIEYLLQAIKIMEDNPNADFKRESYNIIGNLAIAYMNDNQYDLALPLIEKAYELAVAVEDQHSIVLFLTQLARYYGREDAKQAVKYGKQALQIAEKTNYPHLIGMAELILMQSYLRLNDVKSAFPYVESLLLKVPEDDWVLLQQIYLDASFIYAAMGKVAKAFDYKLEAEELMRKISDKNLHDALQEMEVKYEVEQKEIEHQAEIKRQKTLLYISISGLLIAGLLITLLIYIVMLRNKRNRELAEMNATKDKFFRIISHDLRNPAISQRDALQLLLENSEEWDTESISKYYKELLKSANSQVVLLENLLNWSQLQSKRMPYCPTPFNLTAALQADIDLIQNMAEQKGITFDIQIPEKAIVTGDDNMLAIVIRNLLTNAVKFTDTGGTVTLDITESRGRKSSTPTETAYTIFISDTGTGMTPDQLQNIFCRDGASRVSTTGTAGEQASGLGLIVCKELIEKHGTTLQIESAEGKGSRFWFEISG